MEEIWNELVWVCQMCAFIQGVHVNEMCVMSAEFDRCDFAYAYTKIVVELFSVYYSDLCKKELSNCSQGPARIMPGR